MTVVGFEAASEKIQSEASISISTSRDEVVAPIFYREVNLPFVDAVKDPTRIRWRFGDDLLAESSRPIVLENLPVCGNCHSFSADGSVLGMDVDYANDKGSYVITPVAEEMVLDKTQDHHVERLPAGGRRADVRPAVAGLARRSVRGEHGEGPVGLRPHARTWRSASSSFRSRGSWSIYDRETKQFQRLARRRRPGVRSEQSDLESGREVHRLRPEQGLPPEVRAGECRMTRCC